jgi:hypothetical protein
MREMSMQLRRLLGRIWATEPEESLGRSMDWLPPVLGPSEWSCGLMQAMADSSAAWHFDRQ